MFQNIFIYKIRQQIGLDLWAIISKAPFTPPPLPHHTHTMAAAQHQSLANATQAKTCPPLWLDALVANLHNPTW